MKKIKLNKLIMEIKGSGKIYSVMYVMTYEVMN